MSISNTELNPTREQLIAQLVQETLKQKAVLLPTVTDYSAWGRPGASQVGISKRDTFAAEQKSENTNLTKQLLTFTADTIVFDKKKAILAEVEEMAEVESNVPVEQEIIMDQAAELALQIDRDLLACLDNVSTAAPDHLIAMTGTGNVVAKDDVINARKLLNDQRVPMDDRFMLVSPAQEAELLKIDQFIEVDKYGPGAQPISTGELGRIYGFRVLMHTEVASTDCFWYHKSAVGFARQLSPQFKTDDNLENVAKQYLLFQKYGCVHLGDGLRAVKGDATGV